MSRVMPRSPVTSPRASTTGTFVVNHLNLPVSDLDSSLLTRALAALDDNPLVCKEHVRHFLGIEIVVCLAREHRGVRRSHQLRDDLIRKDEAAFSVFQEDAVGQIVDQRAQRRPFLFKAVLEALCLLLHLVAPLAIISEPGDCRAWRKTATDIQRSITPRPTKT